MAHVYATRHGSLAIETRGVMTSWPSGYGWTDPSAIPPPGMGHMQRAGVLVTEHTMLQVDVVFMALRVLSNNIIKMGDLWAYREVLSPEAIPYRQYLSDRPEILADTFGGGRLGGRGGAMMQCTGRDRTVWSMALLGEAFWYVLARDQRPKTAGLPIAVEVLHPLFMEVKTDDFGQPVYIYGSGQNRRELDRDDVIHIPFKSLPGARRAMSPIEYAGVAGALAMAAYEFGSTWFSQGASPSFLLSTEQRLGQAEIDRIAQKFLIEHSGLSQSHLPLVLDNGLKATKVLNTPDEAQYLQTLEYARQVIGAWFGIPASKIGNALQRLTPQPAHTQEQETTAFLQDTLSGYMVPLEEAHSGLLPQGQKAGFAEHLLAKPDAQFLSQLITALRQSQVASINDLRTRYLGWAPVEGGDEVLAPLASNTAPEQTPNAGGNAEADSGDDEL